MRCLAGPSSSIPFFDCIVCVLFVLFIRSRVSVCSCVSTLFLVPNTWRITVNFYCLVLKILYKNTFWSANEMQVKKKIRKDIIKSMDTLILHCSSWWYHVDFKLIELDAFCSVLVRFAFVLSFFLCCCCHLNAHSFVIENERFSGFISTIVNEMHF